ncbi:MAG: S8 family serine peptidase [Blastocatellia bacterium]
MIRVFTSRLRFVLVFILTQILVVSPVLSLPRVQAATGIPMPHLDLRALAKALAQELGQPHRPGELLVKFRAEAAPEQVSQIIDLHGREFKPAKRGSGGGQGPGVPNTTGNTGKLILKEGMTTVNTLPVLKQLTGVIEWVEPNYIVAKSDEGTGRRGDRAIRDVSSARAARADSRVHARTGTTRRTTARPALRAQGNQNTPNDPQYAAQWALNNTAQNGGAPGADIRAQAGWQKSRGDKNTIVAVIDTGIDHNHADLRDNLYENKRERNGQAGVDDDGNGFTDDVNGWNFVAANANIADDQGHGTAMAGLIAAAGNNNMGISGVMWNGSLMSLKALDASGSGSISDVVEAIQYAIANGASVINCSFGTSSHSQALLDAINQAAGAGVIVVASAGNSAQDIGQ